MSIDPKKIELARGKLAGKFNNRSSMDHIVEFLTGFSPFDEMDDENIEAIVKEAMSGLGGAYTSRLQSGGTTTSRVESGRARQLQDGIKLSAPFRFVTLPDQVAMPLANSVDDIGLPHPEGYTATLSVEWVAEGPLLIGEVNPTTKAVEPLRLGPSGPYAIPGASLRGLVRSAVEIIAYGRLGAGNLHHRYGLRDFEHPAYGEGGSPVSRVGEVHAGWLEWKQDDGKDGVSWHVTPCDWSHIFVEKMLESNHARWATNSRIDWIGRSLDDKYACIGIKNGKAYDFKKTFGFSPAPEEKGRRVVAPGGGKPGAFVFSGKLPGKGGNKKFEYVFFDRPNAKSVTLKRSSVETFERLYSKPSKNRPAPDGSWKDLRPTLQNNGRIPVFYVGDLERQNRQFSFGLTRLFKVPHERSVGDVLKAQPKHLAQLERDSVDGQSRYSADFVENLFGFVAEPELEEDAPANYAPPKAMARKGRVSFGFATLKANQETRLSQSVAAIMLAPRASFAPFYLKSEAEKDYSAATPPKLAGRKRYLPRWTQADAQAAVARIDAMGKEQIRQIQEASRGAPVSNEIKSELKFLLPKTGYELRFTSEIRLHNVTAAELGAVLFALTHGGDPTKPYRHMLGRARPFGAGQIRVGQAKLQVQANDGSNRNITPPDATEIADATGKTGFCPPSRVTAQENASHRPFLDAFVAAMKTATQDEKFPNTPAVLEFLGASDPAEGAKLDAAKRLDYLPLKDFNEIRKATKPLKPPSRGGPAQGPAVFPEARDGRTLAAPLTNRKLFWV